MLSFNPRFLEMWAIPDEVLRTGADEDILAVILDQLVDPHAFMERAEYLYDHRDETALDELRLRDGRVFERFSAPAIGTDGTYYGHVWYFRDITERKRTEERISAQYSIAKVLAESAELEDAAPMLLRAVAAGFGWELGAFWVVDRDAGVLRCVDVCESVNVDATAFEEVTRARTFAPGEGLPGRVWATRAAAWVPELAEDDNFPRLDVAAAAELHTGFAFPALSRDEVVGVMEFFSRDIREPDREVLDIVASIGRQVGQFMDRKSAEKALRTSEARKTAILESALDCVVTIDHRGAVVEWNPMAEKTFGYARDDVLGKEMAELIIPVQLRQAHREGLARYLETGKGPVLGKRIEMIAHRADGSEFPVELAITRVEVPGPPLFTGYLRDITDRRHAEEERQRLLALEKEARAAAEEAQHRLAFLAEASRKFSASLDYRQTLQTLVDLVVPYLADWSFVDVLHDNGALVRVALSFDDPAKKDLAAELARPVADEGSQLGISKVLAEGGSTLVSEVTDEIIQELAGAPGRLEVLRELNPRSYMIVPLVGRGRIIGAMGLISTRASRRYSESDLALAEDLAGRAAVAIDNARLYQEKTYVARTLQKALLPPSLPPIPGIDVAARYEPAGEGIDVGGDFFDVFRWGRRRWAVVIGDVAGKGAEAAAMTGLARHTLRAVAREQRTPSAILRLLNDAVLQSGPKDKFCTAVFATLELEPDGTVWLSAASGGHPSPLVLRGDGSMLELTEAGTLIGLLDDVDLTESRMKLLPEDTILFYTDGLTDVRGVEPDPESLFREGVARGGADPKLIADHIRDRVVELQDGDPADDIAIVVARVTGEPDQRAS